MPTYRWVVHGWGLPVDVGVGVAVAVGVGVLVVVVRVGVGDAVVGEAVGDDDVGDAVGVAVVELVGLGLGLLVGLPVWSGRFASRRLWGRRFLSAATAVEQPVRPTTPTTPSTVRRLTGGLSMGWFLGRFRPPSSVVGGGGNLVRACGSAASPARGR
jgi:hypothetical protein